MKIQYYQNSIKRSPDIDALFSKHFPDSEHLDGDIIVCSGGDGTMLHCIQSNLNKAKPFFGIGAGTVNFMMNDASDILTKLKQLSEDTLSLEFVKTFSIHAEVFDGETGASLYSGDGINDIVIGGDVASFGAFKINSTDDTFDTTLRTTGICISTPLGSTAYNMNLGGSVIPRLDLEIFSFVTNSAESHKAINCLTNAQKITIEKTDSNYDAFIAFDCSKKNRFALKKGDKVVISMGQWFELGFLNKKNFELNRLIKYSSK